MDTMTKPSQGDQQGKNRPLQVVTVTPNVVGQGRGETDNG